MTGAREEEVTPSSSKQVSCVRVLKDSGSTSPCSSLYNPYNLSSLQTNSVLNSGLAEMPGIRGRYRDPQDALDHMPATRKKRTTS